MRQTEGTQGRTGTTQRRGIENKEAILAAARQAFSTMGYHGVRTRAIAAAAGIDLGHLNYYYKTKDALWREVLVEFAAECERPLLQGVEELRTKSIDEIAHDCLSQYLNVYAAQPGLTKLLLGELYESSPRYSWLHENVGHRLWQAAKPIFEALHEAGFLGGASPFLAYANLVSGALLGFACPQEIAKIAGGDVSSGSSEERLNALLQPVLTRATLGGQAPAKT